MGRHLHKLLSPGSEPHYFIGPSNYEVTLSELLSLYLAEGKPTKLESFVGWIITQSKLSYLSAGGIVEESVEIDTLEVPFN